MLEGQVDIVIGGMWYIAKTYIFQSSFHHYVTVVPHDKPKNNIRPPPKGGKVRVGDIEKNRGCSLGITFVEINFLMEGSMFLWMRPSL